jgi:N6-adenosine-specific RNA methylase IME4
VDDIIPPTVEVLVADPPWKFGDGLSGQRGAVHKYPVMSVDRIARYRIPVMADHAMLFMWRVSAMLEEALFVCRAWGFRPYGEIVWVKETRSGKPHFGMGHVVRAAHESCLIGVRGKRIAPVHMNERSVFRGIVREHSEKPDQFYNLIERMYPDAVKCELFARRMREGWCQEGNQLGILNNDDDWILDSDTDDD